VKIVDTKPAMATNDAKGVDSCTFVKGEFGRVENKHNFFILFLTYWNGWRRILIVKTKDMSDALRNS